MSENNNTLPNNNDLPNDVSSSTQLAYLPDKFLSDDKNRPLKYIYTINKDTENEQHIDLKYALKPILYSVVFILLFQALEPLAFYGIVTTETQYLLGSYNKLSWGPSLSASQASTFESITQGVAFSAPLIGGIIADGLLGDFNTIIMSVTCLYLPGLLLIALTTFPGILGSDFNYAALKASLLVLMPIGMGFNKACMNAFGAKQFHPILQSSMLEQYFVFLYVTVNAGGLVGNMGIAVLAQMNIQVAYLIPVCSLLIGLLVFWIGSNRYVKAPPQPTTIKNTLKLIGQKFVCKSLDASKKSNGGGHPDSFVQGVKRLIQIVPVAFLVIPFSIAYESTYSVLVIQGTAMRSLGMMDASFMQCFNPIFVLIFGYLIGNILYPYLTKHNIKISTTHKFAYGTTFGALFLGWSWIIDRFMKKESCYCCFIVC